MKSIIKNYGNVSEIIKKRLDEFLKVNDKVSVFYELCFCLLTPQSNARKCDEAIRTLKDKNFFLADMDVEDVKKILITRTRFHNNKANYLIGAKSVFEVMWGKFDFFSRAESSILRQWLVDNVKGMGYKEASHFLRNVGFRDLAILDRHILRNLDKFNVISEIPKSMPKNKYLLIEKNFKDFSDRIGIKMDELDLYFWYCETGEVFK